MILKTLNFKTIQLALFFVEKQNKDTNVYRFLLPKVMIRKTLQYQSKREISIQLEELYGSKLSVNTLIIADTSVIVFLLTIPNPKLVNDESLLPKAIELLKEVSSNPVFDDVNIHEEIRILRERLTTRFENKERLASELFNEHLFTNVNLRHLSSGDLNDLENFNKEELIATYQRLLTNDHFYLASGNLSADDELLIKELFKEKQLSNQVIFPHNHLVEISQTIVKQITMSQSIIKIGYSLPIARTHKLFEAANVFNIILGGSPNSKLFTIIREQEGLAYSVYSTFSSLTKTLSITAGVNSEKSDFAKNMILEVVSNVIKNVTQIELDFAKKYYMSKVIESYENQQSLTTISYMKIIMNVNKSITEKFSDIENITLKDLKMVGTLLEHKLSFILQGDNNESL